MGQGNLYVISAPSGAGKTSLIQHLIEKLSYVKLSISHTTRSIRAKEQDGRDYYFVSKDKFTQMLASGDFLEHAEVFDNYYGTSKSWVDLQLSQGFDVLLELDWQGARQIRKIYNNKVVTIFILPPELAALKERLLRRNQDNADIITHRMQKAQEEISHYDEYDYIVVNSEFPKALEDLATIMLSRRLTIDWQKHNLCDLLKNLLKNYN